MHCDVNSLRTVKQSEISQERSKITNFCKRIYQPILRYLYAETIKRRGKISLYRRFNEDIYSLVTRGKKLTFLWLKKIKENVPYGRKHGRQKSNGT